MGYDMGLNVFCPEAPLPQPVAELTCVHTLMCCERTSVSLQSGKEPRTLCSMRMPL